MERQRGVFDDGLPERHGDDRADIGAGAELPGPPALRPETVRDHALAHGGAVAHGVQREAAQLHLHGQRHGEKVHGMRGKETAYVVRHSAGSVRIRSQGDDERRELRVSHADAGRQVRGHGIQKG